MTWHDDDDDDDDAGGDDGVSNDSAQHSKLRYGRGLGDPSTPLPIPVRQVMLQPRITEGSPTTGESLRFGLSTVQKTTWSLQAQRRIAS